MNTITNTNINFNQIKTIFDKFIFDATLIVADKKHIKDIKVKPDPYIVFEQALWMACNEFRNLYREKQKWITN